MRSPPRISIQVVTWNSAEVIDACLESVSAQRSSEFEVIVVDNASTDGSAERAATWFAGGLRGSLIRETVNRGFCGGQNLALAASSGDWVLFLNPDATLPPDFVEWAIAVVDGLAPEVGSVAPRILLPDGRIDSAGLVLDRFRRLYDRGRGEAAAARYAVEDDVLGGTGAVALHRRAMLDDVAIDGEVLDERLFAYYDDLDLAWRARLRGWRCRYVPSLMATHRRAARNALRGLEARATRGAEQALTVRNRYLVMVKCERLRDVVTAAPRLLPFEIARLAFLLVRAPGALRGYRQAAAALPAALRQRRLIRSGARRDREGRIPALLTPWSIAS
ncbi:MAG: glycosyltransferase family 2 protein [bacterium]|nr:glycosyltransferase family 2 protein [bacterium]